MSTFLKSRKNGSVQQTSSNLIKEHLIKEAIFDGGNLISEAEIERIPYDDGDLFEISETEFNAIMKARPKPKPEPNQKIEYAKLGTIEGRVGYLAKKLKLVD